MLNYEDFLSFSGGEMFVGNITWILIIWIKYVTNGWFCVFLKNKQKWWKIS